MSEICFRATSGQPSSSKFLFVEVGRSGKSDCREVRTAIQKHVMIGTKKRRGRAKQPKPLRAIRKAFSNLGAADADVDADVEEEIEAVAEDAPKDMKGNAVSTTPNLEMPNLATSSLAIDVPRPFLGGGRMNPFAQYPVEMSMESLFLVDHVYTSSDIRMTPFRDSWLPLSTADPAAFCEVLSHVSLHIGTLRTGNKDVELAVKYHSAALNSVNQRLSDPVYGVSDSVVQAIIGFACFSHAKKDWDAYNAHVAGLKAIFRLRGGIHTLDHNRILRLLLSGIDVAASCFQNKPLEFPTPLVALNDLKHASMEIPWATPVDGLPKLWIEVFPSDSALSCIFADICATVMLIKSELPRKQLWNSPTFAQQCVDPLVYRLLESTVDIEDITEDNFMKEACRVTALIFLASVRRKFTARQRRRLIFTGVEQEKLKAIMLRFSKSWRTFRPLLLWVCVIAGIEAEAEDERAWWAYLLAQAAQEMGKMEWEDIMMPVRNQLWVSEVLDAKCEAFSEVVMMQFPSH